jgi:hypothetical protein
MAAMMHTMASSLKTKGRCLNAVFQDARPRAEISEIVMAPCRPLVFDAYHHNSSGTTSSNPKYQGWPKLIFLK